MTPLPRDRGGRFERFAAYVVLPLLLAALLLVVIGIRDPAWFDWRAWLDGPERGTWHALALDGQDVRHLAYSLAIADGAIAGGHDNCNSWGWAGERDPQMGERSMTSTLVACPKGPADAAYWALASSPSQIALRPDGHLEIRAAGHLGLFERPGEPAGPPPQSRGSPAPPVPPVQSPKLHPAPPAPPPPPGVPSPRN